MITALNNLTPCKTPLRTPKANSSVTRFGEVKKVDTGSALPVITGKITDQDDERPGGFGSFSIHIGVTPQDMGKYGLKHEYAFSFFDDDAIGLKLMEMSLQSPVKLMVESKRKWWKPWKQETYNTVDIDMTQFSSNASKP